MLVGLGIILYFHERKGLAVAVLPLLELEAPERLPHFAIANRAMDRNQAGDRMRAQRFHEGDLLLRRWPRGRQIRCAELVHELAGEEIDERAAIFRRGVDDLHQCRPAPGLHAEKAAAKCGAILSGERGRN